MLLSWNGASTRRRHKTTIAEVASRVARLERTIVAISSNVANYSPLNDHSDLSITRHVLAIENTATNGANPANPSNEETLVQNKSRYFNEVILSRILDEVQDQEGEVLSVFSATNESKTQEGIHQRISAFH
jgi:hypothetical protein